MITYGGCSQVSMLGAKRVFFYGAILLWDLKRDPNLENDPFLKEP